MTTEEFAENIREKFQRRYYKREKAAFFEFCRKSFSPASVVSFETGSAENILIGDVAGADTVITAHYDTARNAVINIKLYYDRALVKTFVRLPMIIASAFLSFRTNRVSMNDNTSGIVALFDIVKRTGCAAILFDNEESGYSGSMAIARRSEFRDKRFINLDSVGVGDSFAVIYNSGEKEFGGRLAKRFPSGTTCDKLSGTRYSSDGDFLKHAVTVAAFKRDRKGLRYIDDIHTRHDTELNFQNVAAVSDAVSGFLSDCRTEEF